MLLSFCNAVQCSNITLFVLLKCVLVSWKSNLLKLFKPTYPYFSQYRILWHRSMHWSFTIPWRAFSTLVMSHPYTQNLLGKSCYMYHLLSSALFLLKLLISAPNCFGGNISWTVFYFCYSNNNQRHCLVLSPLTDWQLIKLILKLF